MNIQNWTRTVLTHTIYVFYMCKYTYIYIRKEKDIYMNRCKYIHHMLVYISNIYIHIYIVFILYLYCIYIYIYVVSIYIWYMICIHILVMLITSIYIIMYISRQCTLLIKGSLVRRLPNYGRWSWLAFKLTPSCQPHHHVNHPSSSNWDM